MKLKAENYFSAVATKVEKTSETVFVKNECFITPFLLTHTLKLFDLQDDLSPLDPQPTDIPTTIIKKIKKITIL